MKSAGGEGRAALSRGDRACAAALFVALAHAASGCLGGTGAGAGGGGGTPTTFPGSCADSLDDVYSVPTDLSTFDDAARGAIVAGLGCVNGGACPRCSTDAPLSTTDISKTLSAAGDTDAPATSVRVYHLAYRTARLIGQKGPSSGVSAALLFVPEAPKDPHVLVVSAHDTVGFGDACAPSLTSASSPSDPARTLNLALAGAGWIVIAPDLAGFNYGGEPEGWLLAEDEAHSLLDASRAVSNLLPKSLAPEKVVLVGVGQGGHAVLAAQAFARDYGLAGDLVGVAAFAPIWTTPRTYGALLAEGVGTKNDPEAIALDLLYFYGHGELYDGPGGGIAMFQPASQKPVSEFVRTYCITELEKNVVDLGASPTDFFDPTFVDQIGSCGALGPSGCKTSLAKTWNDRFVLDRPSVNPKGAPIVVYQGGEDEALPPSSAVCGKDVLESDVAVPGGTTKITYCGDDTATHETIVTRHTSWVSAWISSVASNGPATPSCPDFAPKTGTGTPIACKTPPPND